MMCIFHSVDLFSDFDNFGIMGDDKVSDEDVEIFNSFVTAMQNAVQEEEEELMKEEKSKHSDSNDGYAKDGKSDVQDGSKECDEDIEVGSRNDDQLSAPLSSSEW